MSDGKLSRRSLRALSKVVATTVLALAAGGALGLLAVTHLAAEGQVVSQKGRSFRPETVILSRGETITIVNDDSDLQHHLYVESDVFNFDSGDQAPGSRTPVKFTEKGVFTVLCGIHPKMKLFVRVN